MKWKNYMQRNQYVHKMQIVWCVILWSDFTNREPMSYMLPVWLRERVRVREIERFVSIDR